MTGVYGGTELDTTEWVLSGIKRMREMVVGDSSALEVETAREYGGVMKLDASQYAAHAVMLENRVQRGVATWRDVLNGDVLEVFAAMNSEVKLRHALDKLIANAVGWQEASLRRGREAGKLLLNSGGGDVRSE